VSNGLRKIEADFIRRLPAEPIVKGGALYIFHRTRQPTGSGKDDAAQEFKDEVGSKDFNMKQHDAFSYEVAP